MNRKEFNKKIKRRRLLLKIKNIIGTIITFIWCSFPMVIYIYANIDRCTFEYAVLTFLLWISYTILFILMKGD